MPKLTLNADAKVIEQAKHLAAERGTSVSALFARFVKALAGDRDNAPQSTRLGKLTRQATGVVDLGGRDDADVLAEALKDKHGL